MTNATTNKPEAEVLLVRTYDAPREMVFKAWTDSKQMAKWWGPRVFTNPVCEIDARPGGAILIHMQAPDGTVFPMTGTFKEVVEPERLVFANEARDGEGNTLLEGTTTVVFAEEGGKTVMTVHSKMVGLVDFAPQMLAGMEEGWSQSLDKLQDLLEGNILSTATTEDRELRLSRVLEAPVALVWEVWTNPEHNAKWWGPNGFTNTISVMDVRPEGEWNLVMHGPDGTDYKNRNIFKEVVRHRKIVYEHVSAPKFISTIEFEDQGDTTLLTWHMLFETVEQFEQVVKTFKAGEGLKQNIEKLAAYVKEMA